MYKDGQPVYKTEPLTAKDTRFKEKGFMVQRDQAYQRVMAGHGYEFDINDSQSPYLAQKKLYKGASEDYLESAKAWNEQVKEYNENVREIIRQAPEKEKEYKAEKKDIKEKVKEANRKCSRAT